jgi:hypothetical protein
LLDKQEPWSRLHFQGWNPQVDAALLIGLPMSPLVYAAARLRSATIPYVVDIGDPWMLTNPDPPLHGLAAARAIRAERQLWSAASGAVVTTGAQADAISALHPTMPILVRPNGYELPQAAAVGELAETRKQPTATLRLVHFGNLYSLRLDIGSFFSRLVESDRWREITFTQYGSDWSGQLNTIPSAIRVETHLPVAWEQAIKVACEHDAAIVIGNKDAQQLPSKAVQYLTLPIPRVALTNGQNNDALTQYVSGKAGWMTATTDDTQVAKRLYDHVARKWSATELAPPPSDAWPRVANEIAGFVGSVLSTREPSI